MLARFSRIVFGGAVVGTAMVTVKTAYTLPWEKKDGKEKDKVMLGTRGDIKIFAGNAHRKLANQICDLLGVPVGDAVVNKFANGETQILINESVRDQDCFIIQPTCNPTPNDYLMELVIYLDAMRRGGAARITAVIPVFGYARQDKKDMSRAAITAKVVADMLHNAGADRVLCIDLHAPQIQGFVNFPIDNLYASPLIIKYIKEQLLAGADPETLTIVSPDAGGAKRADSIAKALHCNLAICSKKREKANEVASMVLVGEVVGKKCVIVDDMIDTAGSMVLAAKLLEEHGATEVHAAVVHGVLSPPAVSRINGSVLKSLIVTDTIPMDQRAKECPKLTVLPVAPLLAQAIRNLHYGDSLSKLFYPEAVDSLPKPIKQ